MMYNNPYNMYSQQSNLDRINAQMAELEKMKQQIQQPQQTPTNLTQNFQLAPQNNTNFKLVNSIDEVKKELVITDTVFINNDYTKMWIKNNKAEIKNFDIQEIKEKDEKDIIIEKLQYQIYELNNKLEEVLDNEQFDESDNERKSKQRPKSSKAKTTTTISNDRTDDEK